MKTLQQKAADIMEEWNTTKALKDTFICVVLEMLLSLKKGRDEKINYYIKEMFMFHLRELTSRPEVWRPEYRESMKTLVKRAIEYSADRERSSSVCHDVLANWEKYAAFGECPSEYGLHPSLSLLGDGYTDDEFLQKRILHGPFESKLEYVGWKFENPPHIYLPFVSENERQLVDTLQLVDDVESLEEGDKKKRLRRYLLIELQKEMRIIRKYLRPEERYWRSRIIEEIDRRQVVFDKLNPPPTDEDLF